MASSAYAIGGFRRGPNGRRVGVMLFATCPCLRSLAFFCGLMLAPLWGCNDSGGGGGNSGGASAAAGGGAGKEAGGGAGTQSSGGSGGAVVTGGAGGTTPATGGSGGVVATVGSGGVVATGGSGGTAVDPDACPTAPQGKMCDVTSCNYNIDGKTGRCLCNNDFFVCAKLPAPDGSAACPANANQTNCRPLKVGTFCRLTDVKFCVCQSIGASDLWACP
jgi:hypothetical protein